MKIKSVGSICSGIEAASVAWEPLGLKFKWFSEIAEFPSKVLKEKYPDINNLGDMNDIPDMIKNEEVDCPDLICGGTPCQAFSLAGWKNGLEDDRGNLTLKFVDIVEANDSIRLKKGLKPSIVFWENVEGVLTDKTNAFGCLISSLAGFSNVLDIKRWPNAGVVRGPKRNIAWRVLDAKYFGIPQQRKRLYLLAGGKDFFPENVLLEENIDEIPLYPKSELAFEKDGNKFEIFREYTDCLYSAYGTKWNGNAAAYNGSLFVVQNGRIRRLSPLECERLMGFPDEYTNLKKSKRTQRYQAVGNSWSVPVIKWIGERLIEYTIDSLNLIRHSNQLGKKINYISDEGFYLDLGKDIISFNNISLNCTYVPENAVFGHMKNIISSDVSEKLYISPVGCHGMVRRKRERNLSMNSRLEEILLEVASKLSIEEIEKRSRVQKRGRFSESIDNESDNIILEKKCNKLYEDNECTQLSLF
ncbi:MAG: DNA cytosine methyltransferase [Terrisporobacter othiniensis]|nr:DNA cytosine methyltransferase [Terrisporobacter othiniensis]MDU6994255.1 DNA cytosine methyltransferase [Terrisporobacter othiniensis]